MIFKNIPIISGNLPTSNPPCRRTQENEDEIEGGGKEDSVEEEKGKEDGIDEKEGGEDESKEETALTTGAQASFTMERASTTEAPVLLTTPERAAVTQVEQRGKEDQFNGGGKQFEVILEGEEKDDDLGWQEKVIVRDKAKQLVFGQGSGKYQLLFYRERYDSLCRNIKVRDIERTLATIHDTHGHFSTGITAGRRIMGGVVPGLPTSGTTETVRSPEDDSPIQPIRHDWDGLRGTDFSAMQSNWQPIHPHNGRLLLEIPVRSRF